MLRYNQRLSLDPSPTHVSRHMHVYYGECPSHRHIAAKTFFLGGLIGPNHGSGNAAVLTGPRRLENSRNGRDEEQTRGAALKRAINSEFRPITHTALSLRVDKKPRAMKNLWLITTLLACTWEMTDSSNAGLDKGEEERGHAVFYLLHNKQKLHAPHGAEDGDGEMEVCKYDGMVKQNWGLKMRYNHTCYLALPCFALLDLEKVPITNSDVPRKVSCSSSPFSGRMAQL